MTLESHPARRRIVQGLTSFAISILFGIGVGLLLCTPRQGSEGWSPSTVVATGLGACVAAFVLMMLVGLGSIGAGLRDARRQLGALPPARPISTPAWMAVTVRLRMALAYVMYVCLGIAMGGGVAALLGSLSN